MQQDGLGLDVAVDNAVAVGVLECARHLPCEPNRVADGELPLALQTCPERLAGDERPDVVEQPIGRAAVEQGENVGMLQPGRRPDLAQEPLAA